ncbi:CapA family protein [Pararhodonellum marinum]|uniref:CapA family protein n=1 Tax=Pararhodonellum marinum TaxID=2755358 RepID=UPI00188FEE5B|nr:CapA family protein [Pararhodonellum marinum]
MISCFVSGDFCPKGRVEETAKKGNFDLLFGKLVDQIKGSDLAITNMEAPLTISNKPILKTGPSIKVHPDTIHVLKKGGFDLLTLANNHIMDYGEEGLAESIKSIDGIGLKSIGAGINFEEASKPYYFEKNGYVLAVINFAENEWSTTFNQTPGANPLDPVGNYNQIQFAKMKADKVLVITHGGHEHYPYPSPRMKSLFRFFVDAGASAVVNHHPHCISGFEWYKGCPIFYSLGNFIFDYPERNHLPWNIGMTVQLHFSDEKTRIELTTFDQCNEEIGILVHDEIRKEEVNNELKKINEIISDDLKLKNEFDKMVLSKEKTYKNYIEPIGNKYLKFLINKKVIPSFLSEKKKRYLLNLTRCESHRDILISILERYDRHQ